MLKPAVFLLSALLAATLVAGCRAGAPAASGAPEQPVWVLSRAPLRPRETCTGRFVPHDLDHITTVSAEPVTMFDSNGAGLAVNDLDNDGDLDIVLANLAGNNAIFWNEGNLAFQKETLDHGQSRGVSVVDVDGDGWLDLVFTRQWSAPTLWRNEGGRFELAYMAGVTKPAYALNWGDVDGDGDLDLVTASYDAALEKDLGNSFLLGEGGGVYMYLQEAGGFRPERLANAAQGLVVYLHDVDEDGRPDILVGNDFDVPDRVWLRRPAGWEEADPFAATTHSTMSIDSGDVDNDGRPELVAADMKPYADDPLTLAAWQPVMDMMMHGDGDMEGDPQVMENVLQRRSQNGRFRNEAPALGLDATGWSWSTKFGDLDNDGYLDLYVVNGMAAAELFASLPRNELVEENQALRNDGGRAFTPAPEWGLNATEGGRGMSLADLDDDGDLDIVINNLLAPARIFENRLCAGGGLAVDLFWPESGNTRALGARVTLQTSRGRLTRDVRANSGYLSGDPARLHFGFPEGTTLERLIITWPDGARSFVEPVSPQTLVQIERPPTITPAQDGQP